MEDLPAALFLSAPLLGIIPAMIASSKGRTFFLWWLYGTGLFIIALPHALLTKKNVKVLEEKSIADGSMRKCPSCAELIKAEAKICRYCSTGQPETTQSAQMSADAISMSEHGIRFEKGMYTIDGYDYDNLETALAHARPHGTGKGY